MPNHNNADADDAATANDASIAAGYAAAMAELETILADLEDDALDVDLLATKVERASALIRFCRDRISAARIQVDRIVAELDQNEDEDSDN